MSDIPAEIKAKLPLENIIGESVALKPAGRGKLKGLCPFHNEKTPSFQVDTDKGLYYCFGCHAKGDVFTFVQQTQGLDFLEARDQLAKRAGVEVPEHPERRRTQGLADLQRLAQDYFLRGLAEHPEARAYLAHRGLTDATVTLWGFGFAPGGRYGLLDLAKREGVGVDALIAAGLAKRLEGGKVVEMFRDRLTILILDAHGRLVGFSARTLKDGVQPKYLNTPETELFKKGDILFGLAHARTKLRDTKAAVLVEGQLDVIACHQAGLTTVVGAQSSTLTDAQINALDRLGVERLYLAYDPDAAGQKATLRGLDAVARRFKVFVARLPGQDPADLVREGPDAFRAVLKRAVPELKYRVSAAFEGRDERDPQQRQQILERLKPGMKDLREPYDPVAFELRSAVAARLGMNEDKLHTWANKSRTSKKTTEVVRRPPDVRVELIALALSAPERLRENLDRIKGVAEEDDKILRGFLETCENLDCNADRVVRTYSARDDAASVFEVLMHLESDERRDLLAMALNRYYRDLVLPRKEELRRVLTEHLRAVSNPILTEAERDQHRAEVEKVMDLITSRVVLT